MYHCTNILLVISIFPSLLTELENKLGLSWAKLSQNWGKVQTKLVVDVGNEENSWNSRI